MDNFFYLDIPLFKVRYKRWKKYGCRKANEKENLKKVLSEASGGYCMYCYTRIEVDNKFHGHLEHAIEKNNSNKLIECIPNIGISCRVCNDSFKRIGEKNRCLLDSKVKEFEETSRCRLECRKQCTIPCKALRNLQLAYSEPEGAEIILQPMGVRGKQSKEPLAIQYDIMKMEFQPNTNQYSYSSEEKNFIYKHIQRFRLNDPQYRTRQLVDYIKNIIDNGGNQPKYEYNNIIVKLFSDKLKGKTAKEKVDICSKIYAVVFIKL